MVRLIADVFANDACDVKDLDWMEYGLDHGWSLLTQDGRIRQQRAALNALRAHSGSIFCLSSGNLSTVAKADRFDAHRGTIYRLTGRRHHGFYVVYSGQVVRRWP